MLGVSEKKKIKSIVKVFQDNCVWVTALVTGIGIVMRTIIGLIEYLSAYMSFNYFGLDIRFYRFYDHSFLYNFGMTMITMIVLGTTFYWIWKLRENLKNKRFLCSSNLLSSFMFFVSNLYLVLTLISTFSILSFVINFFLLVMLELYGTSIIFRNTEESSVEDQYSKEQIINFLVSIPLIFIIEIFIQLIPDWFRIIDRKDYRMVNDDTVIVYSSNDYYLTLDCEVNDETLIIYKGTQEKINTTNVPTRLEKFDMVQIQ